MILDCDTVDSIRIRYGESSQIARLCESHELLRQSVESHIERIAAASEVIARCAERRPDVVKANFHI